MLTLQSPKFSTAKAEITKNSPIYRGKRAPSVTDSYSIEEKHRITAQSPLKLSADHKKNSNNQNSTSSLVVKPISKQKEAKKIIESIHQLKLQYKKLKQAYKQLVQEKSKNNDFISKIRKDYEKIQKENQRIFRENQKLKIQVNFLQHENFRVKRQFFKLLQVQKFKTQKLEQSLKEKQQYINQTILQIRTEADDNSIYYPRHGSLINLTQQDVSLTISQDKSAVINSRVNNQNEFLSFSLTSVLQQQTDNESIQRKRKIQHTKAASALVYINCEEDRKPKQMNFKKPKKELIPKLELTKIQSKGNLLKTDGTIKLIQKHSSKGRVSKSFREKQNKESVNQNFKKKSKKFINNSGMTDI